MVSNYHLNNFAIPIRIKKVRNRIRTMEKKLNPDSHQKSQEPDPHHGEKSESGFASKKVSNRIRTMEKKVNPDSHQR
jgi:hypothetical protein